MQFNDKTVQGVWEKGRATNDRDATEWRKDVCGAWIKRDQYGHHQSAFGWKIENVAVGKPHGTEDLRPYQHENSFNQANGQPHCCVTADREGLPPTAGIDTPRNKSTD